MNNRTQIGRFRRSDFALDRFKPLSLLGLRQFWPIYRNRVKVRAVVRYHCNPFLIPGDLDNVRCTRMVVCRWHDHMVRWRHYRCNRGAVPMVEPGAIVVVVTMVVVAWLSGAKPANLD